VGGDGLVHISNFDIDLYFGCDVVWFHVDYGHLSDVSTGLVHGKIIFSSGCLGIVFGVGVCGCCCSSMSQFASFFLYMVVMSVFLWTEYVVTALTNRRTLTVDSFLLNHSRQYWLAAAASWLEYSTRTFLLPGWHSDVMTAFGFILCLLGEVLRKGAMFTARVSFTHTISTRKRSEHQLITSGVYSLCRHPAYVGWFIFSIGTQMILCNMICMVGYAIVAWRFFDLRIFDEEMFLINFFGIDYIEYQRRVPVGLPFITGYRESV